MTAFETSAATALPPPAPAAPVPAANFAMLARPPLLRRMVVDTVDAVGRKFCDARDACFPKTPRFPSFKKNLDFVPFSNFKRAAKR